ncbi:MAG: redox-sensing transcriptional repressor Rex [Bacteroidales bacterium]|nr:redox-sensing transcriptional repressor Rex [Bacteroidales bacterium]
MNNKNRIPDKTVERLLIYKSILSDLLEQEYEYIRSYELAEFANNKPAQVRRDIMSIQYMGHPSKGYNIIELANTINKKLKLTKRINTGIIGMGRLGTAIYKYLKEHSSRFLVSAVFDSNADNKQDLPEICDISKLYEIIKKENITLIILSLPAEFAQEVTNVLNQTKIKGILNFTHAQLKINKHIRVNTVDITLEMEKLTFYSH